MSPESAEPETSAERLREGLLDYLKTIWTVAWPGADGMTVEAVLNSYLEGVGASELQDWPPVGRMHPKLDAAVRKWLAR
jgi:hypothetical protein